MITDAETLKPYNLSMSDIISYSIRPQPFVTPRMLSCFTVDPIPPNRLPDREKIVRTRIVLSKEGKGYERQSSLFYSF